MTAAATDTMGDNVTGSSSRPYYLAVGDEERVFTAAYRQGLSVVLKGPTGGGKTRFVEAMAHDLARLSRCPVMTTSPPQTWWAGSCCAAVRPSGWTVR